MEKLVRTVLRQVHPDTRISKDAKNLLVDIGKSLLASQQAVDIDTWMESNLPVELRRHAQSAAAKAPPEERNMKVVEYIFAEILELSGNYARDLRKNTIDEYHVLFVIYNDSELLQALKTYIPLFSFPPSVRPEFTNLSLPKNRIEYVGTTSDGFKRGLYHIVITLVNHYGKRVDRDLQLRIVTSIIQYARQLNPGGTLSFRNLLDAIYASPELINIPWVEIFRNQLPHDLNTDD